MLRKVKENWTKKGRAKREDNPEPPVREIFIKGDEYADPTPIRSFEDLPWCQTSRNRLPPLLKRLFRS